MKAIYFLLLCATSFLLVGCGGGGGGGSEVSNSPFAGQWRGTWASPSTDDAGTATITVATNGAMTGTMHNNRTGNDGTMNATAKNSGSVSGKAQYPGSDPIGLSGTVTINGSGHLIGNLTQSISGANYPLSFDLQPQ